MKSFDIKNENYHLGHLIWDTLMSRPDAVCQIDGATGESESNAAVLARSIQLAKCFRKFGAKPGDVLALGGRNHMDLHIPFYAALFNGLPIIGVNPLFKYNDINTLFKICSPRIAFCQKESQDDFEKVIQKLGLNTKIICFDEGKHSLAKFIEEYDDTDDQEEFQPATFDVDMVYAFLIPTSGTTGNAKLAAFKHKTSSRKLEELKLSMNSSTSKRNLISGENKIYFTLSPVQTVSAFNFAIMIPFSSLIKLQSSAPFTTEHVIDIINKYKPASLYANPPAATSILKSDKQCDFSCLDRIAFSGCKIHKDVHTELRKRMRPDAVIVEVYGQTESLGPCFPPDPKGPIGNCGKPLPTLPPIKLVDTKTGKEITEPNVTGELWSKGYCFSEYYNNPEETAKAFSEDGWYKTGDIMYRDEEGYYYFVERLRMLIMYRSHQILPVELEAVIREHPDVIDVSVTSVPHDEDGEHAVACVIRRQGSSLTADEVKEMVASKLSDAKRLRGGVVFMDQLPLTFTGKIARGKLRQMVLTAHRE